jgi:glutathione S-transferase
MDRLSLQNPLFATYVIAATLMILKAVSMSWLTVIRMMQVKGGFRSPEDIRKTPLNPEPNPKQLQPDERVERIRRIHLNDLENLPFFLMAGFLYILTEPSLLLARVLLYGYMSYHGCCTSPPMRPHAPMTPAPRSGPSAHSSWSS